MSLTLDTIRRESEQAALLRERADRMLTHTVRAAARAGFSQREIATAVGRSQPEISRLLHFRGSTPLGLKLRKHRAEILAIAREFGLQQIEVFGSVARSTDHGESDVDLLFTTSRDQTLFTLAAAEAAMTRVLGVKVDLVARDSLKPHVTSRALEDATPL